jgi:hypothetical protein
MKKIAILCTFAFSFCSKNNDIPASSTNATVTVTYPDGRTYSFTDFPVLGHDMEYTIDNQPNNPNIPNYFPAEYILDENTSPNFYEYCFFGFNQPNGLYQLNFGTPPEPGVQNFSENIAQLPSLSGMTANHFSFTFQDTAFQPSSLQV